MLFNSLIIHPFTGSCLSLIWLWPHKTKAFCCETLVIFQHSQGGCVKCVSVVSCVWLRCRTGHLVWSNRWILNRWLCRVQLWSSPYSRCSRRTAGIYMCWVRCSRKWWGRNLRDRRSSKRRLIEESGMQRRRGKEENNGVHQCNAFILQ